LTYLGYVVKLSATPVAQFCYTVPVVSVDSNSKPNWPVVLRPIQNCCN